MAEKEVFEYTYAAPANSEVVRIREKVAPEILRLREELILGNN